MSHPSINTHTLTVTLPQGGARVIPCHDLTDAWRTARHYATMPAVWGGSWKIVRNATETTPESVEDEGPYTLEP